MPEKWVKDYIALCGKLCASPNDYDRFTVRKHNWAMDRLAVMAAKLSKEPDLAGEVFGALLKHNSSQVLVSAAAHCLKYEIHTAEAEQVLKKIEKSSDRYAAFQAEMTLKVWAGEISGKEL